MHNKVKRDRAPGHTPYARGTPRVSALRVYACLGALILAFIGGGIPAYADEDPFQMDSGRWMSSDHYQDADKRGILDKIQPPPAPEPPPPPDEAVAAKPVLPTTPVVAAPSRPIDLPVMPGMNKDFDVHVDSTADDSAAPAAPVVTPSAEPDIHLSDKNWQAPVPQKHTANAEGDDSDNADTPLAVRMTFLPSAKITPIPSPERASVPKLDVLMQAKKEAAKSEAKADKAAVCAAIDSYKKQQLEAIQSDRQTLKALEDAISALGLQKQLSFMAGNNTALVNAPNAPIPNSIDASAPTITKQ
jgi:hypothetical protein